MLAGVQRISGDDGHVASIRSDDADRDGVLVDSLGHVETLPRSPSSRYRRGHGPPLNRPHPRRPMDHARIVRRLA